MLNDYSYEDDVTKACDSRWVHRPYMDWKKLEKRKTGDTLEGKIFNRLSNLIRLRKESPIFNGKKNEVIYTGNDHVLGYIRHGPENLVLVLANFSEEMQLISGNQLRLCGKSDWFISLLSGEKLCTQDLYLEPYEFICLASQT